MNGRFVLTCEHGSLGNLGTERHVLLGVLQEIHELHDLNLGLLTAGNVPETAPVRYCVSVDISESIPRL